MAIELEVGDHVFKKKGYRYPGVIVAKFETLAGKTRFVVECNAEAVRGMLHIFNDGQLICPSNLERAKH